MVEDGNTNNQQSKEIPQIRVQDTAEERELLRSSNEESDSEDKNDASDEEEEIFEEDDKPVKKETFREFVQRQHRNLVHFFVEDWFLSAMLGIITAILSISTDIAIEYLQHFRIVLYHWANEQHAYGGFSAWILFMTGCVTAASLFCYAFAKQAVGSGIPEVKVIMHGFALKNYLTLKTLIGKIIGLTLTLGGGLPCGKEGPFVHMGAIVASLLNKATEACHYNAFFSHEGRQIEMLSSGCAVGIACTFSAPAGAVLYGIESTSKYFAVKNYWRSFFATTCAALIFRFVINFLVPPHIAGTITAYYQTSFPNEVFLVEEIPFFLLLGVFSGLGGAFFIFLHRRIVFFKRKNRMFLAVFGKSPVAFTSFFALMVAIITYPEGFGRYIAGKLTFRETLIDFLSNCTFSLSNISSRGCPPEMIDHWTGGTEEFHPLLTLSLYLCIYFFLVAICISLYIPAGVFVPCFVIGACGGRIMGELLTIYWPDGFRGPDGPQIWPGLYAVVGAAAYTGAVTHSLSIAVIVCETTGQLCALLPVLVALMIGNAIASFLQPSIYESIIKIQNYPYLADLPPSRVSVHTMKVEKVMVKDIVFITRETTYKQLRQILIETPTFKSYPFVTDQTSMNLVGSVSRKYLVYLFCKKLGPDTSFERRKSRSPSELFSTFRKSSTAPNVARQASQSYLTDRNISGNTLLAHSPLHDDQGDRSPLAALLYSQTEAVDQTPSVEQRAELMSSPLSLDDLSIDPAPFQLVKGTSLYKVHTLFSLLALNHAYVTDKGRLVGVVAVKELRKAFEHIYSRGAIAPRRRTTSIRSRTDVVPLNGVNGTNGVNGESPTSSAETQQRRAATGNRARFEV